jgi:hypothetical protein
MGKAAQHVIDKLKIMRATGEPVWVSLHGWRLKIRPVSDLDDSSCVEAVYKNRGRIHFGIFAGGKRNVLRNYGCPYEGHGQPPYNFTARWKNILAVVIEKHPRPADEKTGEEA